MILEIKNLSFKYKDNIVLEDISFSVEEGKILGVLGENGVGKSTLFKCILGFLEPKQGRILLDGKNIKDLDLKERARKVAYIPQSHYPTFNHSVINVVEMGSNVRVSGLKMPGEEELEKAYENLKLLGIDHLANRGYKEISGGERQLTLIARALMQEAKILVMDEPTANLDYGNQIKVLNTCRELSKLGYTIIQSTHHPQQAFMFFDDVLLVHDRKILGQGSVKEVLTEENLKTIYGIDLKVELIENEGIKQYILFPRDKVG